MGSVLGDRTVRNVELRLLRTACDLTSAMVDMLTRIMKNASTNRNNDRNMAIVLPPPVVDAPGLGADVT